MKPKTYSIDKLSSRAARQAQTEAAIQARRHSQLGARTTNIGRNFYAPTIRPTRGRTNKTVRSSSFLGIGYAQAGGFVSGLVMDEFGLITTSQQAGNILALIASAQRIR